MLCWTPDDTHDLIGHLILLLTALITVHLCLHIISVLFSVYSLIHMITRYMHMHLPFYFTHSLGRFLTILDLHVQIMDVLFY